MLTWRAMRLCGILVAGTAIGVHGQAPATKSPAPAKQAASKEAKSAKIAVPPAIEAAFRKAFPKATIKNVAKEKENGREQYEVESLDQGLARDLIYLADGSMVEMEEEMSAADFPPAVVAAIKARYSAATITKREKLTITKGNVVQYEAAISGATVKEVILTGDGTWVSPKAK